MPHLTRPRPTRHTPVARPTMTTLSNEGFTAANGVRGGAGTAGALAWEAF